MHNVCPDEVTIYVDDERSWGRLLYSRDLTAFVRDDGSIEIPPHMVSEKVRHEVEDAKDELIAAVRACVEAFPQPGE